MKYLYRFKQDKLIGLAMNHDETDFLNDVNKVR